jgi:Ras-related protein Rab-8A
MHAVEGVNKLLVGCKVDLEKRVVSIDAAQALAKDLGCKYVETSSKDDLNVQQAFEMLMR